MIEGLLALVGNLLSGDLTGLLEWAITPEERPPKPDRRGEIIDGLAQYPLTMIGRLSNGAFARVMGRVVRLDPLTIEDRSGTVTVDLREHAAASLRLALQLGEQITVAGTACVDAGAAWLAGGPYRAGAASSRRLVGTPQKPLLVCDALDRIARKRGR